ncbi:MAG: dapA [Rhizobacter sp.]|nr:dapA [Rhizobacter sp.]
MFSGIWVPLVTPFRNGAVDLDALSTLTERLLDDGVDGIVALGTTGEPASLSHAERLSVLDAVMEVSARRKPVLAGVGGVNTAAVCDEARAYAATGIDGVLVSAPYYLCPSSDGLVWHFKQVAQAVGRLPVMLYNVPKRTGTDHNEDVIEQLMALPNVAAVKECASHNFGWLGLQPLSMMTGDDAALIECMSHGGTGGVMASAHLFAPRLLAVAGAMASGQLATAKQLFEPLIEPIHLLFAQPNPAPLKAALALRGLVRNELRLPMTSSSIELSAQLDACLARVPAMPRTAAMPSGRKSHSASSHA